MREPGHIRNFCRRRPTSPGVTIIGPDVHNTLLTWSNGGMDEFKEAPSTYIWRWNVWSWICVGLAVLIVMMGITSGSSLTFWIIGAIAVAVIGGVGFGFVPRASLNQPKRPMTSNARQKAAIAEAKKGKKQGR